MSPALPGVASRPPSRLGPSAQDQAHGLGAGGGVAHDAAHGGGDRVGAGLAHTPHGHAQVLGLNDHQHTPAAYAQPNFIRTR